MRNIRYQLSKVFFWYFQCVFSPIYSADASDVWSLVGNLNWHGENEFEPDDKLQVRDLESVEITIESASPSVARLSLFDKPLQQWKSFITVRSHVHTAKVCSSCLQPLIKTPRHPCEKTRLSELSLLALVSQRQRGTSYLFCVIGWTMFKQASASNNFILKLKLNLGEQTQQALLLCINLLCPN